MPLTRIDVTDFRNLALIKLEPHTCGFNFFYGSNGSGKSSLLEAIYYLSVGRPFRPGNANRVIRHGADKLSIFAHQQINHEQVIAVGLERSLQGSLKLRIANKDVNSITQLAGLLPALLINSSCYNLLEGGPIFRRKFLDWGNFYLQPDFLRIWQTYAQTLKQRNAALRAGQGPKELMVWNQALLACAVELHELRQAFVALYLPLLLETLSALLEVPNLSISYYAGWDVEHDFAALLAASYGKDRALGFTGVGPHRADFKIKINGVEAKDFLSRGQQKLFVCAMILAQGALLYRSTNKKPIYLIDDLPAELDSTSRARLLALLACQQTQVFVTAVENTALSENIFEFPVKMFHVEQGSVMEVR